MLFTNIHFSYQFIGRIMTVAECESLLMSRNSLFCTQERQFVTEGGQESELVVAPESFLFGLSSEELLILKNK